MQTLDGGDGTAMVMVERLLGACREFGVLAGFVYLASRAFAALSPKLNLFLYEFVVQPVVTAPLSSRRPSQTEVREIVRGDPDIALMPGTAEIKQHRFAQYTRCLGAYREGVLIGYLWLGFGSYVEDEVRCAYDLEPFDESSFDFDVYLFPQYRLGTGFVSLWDGANQYLNARGVHYSFSRISHFNLASRRAHRRLGAEPVGHALFLRASRVEIMIGTVWPFVAVSMRRRIHLRLHAPRVTAAGGAPGAGQPV